MTTFPFGASPSDRYFKVLWLPSRQQVYQVPQSRGWLGPFPDYVHQENRCAVNCKTCY